MSDATRSSTPADAPTPTPSDSDADADADAVPPGDADPAPRGPIAPAPLSKTAAITTFGSLAWIAWVWLATFVIVTGIAVTIGITGDLESSIWQSAAAGWQRWIVLASGVSLVATFAPLLLANGVTRDQLARSAIVSGLVIAALTALFAVVGYLVEGVVFAQNDVVHRYDAYGDRLGHAIDVTVLPGLYLEYVVTVYAAFLTGWQVAIGFFRSDVVGGVLRIPASLVPLVLVEVLLGTSPAAFLDNSWFSDRSVPLGVTVLGSVVVLAAGSLVARRRTAGITLRP